VDHSRWVILLASPPAGADNLPGPTATRAAGVRMDGGWILLMAGVASGEVIGAPLGPSLKRRCRCCGAWFSASVRWHTAGLRSGRPATKVYECDRCGRRYEVPA